MKKAITEAVDKYREEFAEEGVNKGRVSAAGYRLAAGIVGIVSADNARRQQSASATDMLRGVLDGCVTEMRRCLDSVTHDASESLRFTERSVTKTKHIVESIRRDVDELRDGLASAKESLESVVALERTIHAMRDAVHSVTEELRSTAAETGSTLDRLTTSYLRGVASLDIPAVVEDMVSGKAVLVETAKGLECIVDDFVNKACVGTELVALREQYIAALERTLVLTESGE